MPITTHNTASGKDLVQPFSFTGKEWCKSQWLAQRGLERGISETGYSYFGARYYDSDLIGLFLCVDPLADKYPSLSPYAYCAWNPVKLVDPDGMKIDLSNLTNEQRSQYHKRIETLKKNEFFCYYYSKLEESNNNYCIQMLDNSNDSKSGYFIPNKEQLNSPASYIQDNSGREAKAIKLVLSAIYE